MRRLKLLVPLLGAAFLAVALWLLGRELHSFRPSELEAYLRSLPAWRIAAALALTALNYGVLTGYDALALRYVRQRVAYRRSALASFIGYAVSLLLGHAVVTGGAVRYRLYTSWGVPPDAVAKIIAFCGLAFWMGFLSLGAAVFIIDPLPLAGFPVGPRVLGWILAAAFAGWLALNAARAEPVRVWRWRVDLPGWRSTLGQAAVASLDLVLAASVLWVLLPPDAPLPPGHLLSAFLLAVIAGTVSMVPGGAGVFDGILVALITPAVPPAAALGALVAYRAIYYLLPFVAATLTLGAVEAARHRRARTRGAGPARAAWGQTFVPRALAAAVFACGALLLFSGVLPHAPAVARAARALPLGAIEAAHVVAMAAGGALLVVSRALCLRRGAGVGTAALLLAAGAAAVLVRGTDARVPVFLGLALAALLACRAKLGRGGAPIAAPGSTEWLGMLAWVLVSATWLGLHVHRGVPYGHHLWWSFAVDADAPRFLRGMAAGVLAVVACVVLVRRGAPHDKDGGASVHAGAADPASVVGERLGADADLADPGGADWADAAHVPQGTRRRRWGRIVAGGSAALVILWLLAAYGIAPEIWRSRERPHFEGTPRRAATSEGIPADPLNVGIVGSRDGLVRALAAAGWRPADPVTLRSSVGIVASVGLHRPDSTAPVSPLYLFGRRQDLAFEKPVGGSARRRHHVRLWALPAARGPAAGAWTGAATFDRGVGLSRYTRQVTHHIAPDVDAERDTLMADLAAAGALAEIRIVPGMGPTLNGRNGGGDWFYTDGEMMVGVLRGPGAPNPAPPLRPPPPASVRFKNASWRPARLLLP